MATITANPDTTIARPDVAAAISTVHRCSACPDESVRSTGRGLATAVVLTLDELEGLAYCTPDLIVRERLLCAIALHDTEREKRIREDLDLT